MPSLHPSSAPISIHLIFQFAMHKGIFRKNILTLLEKRFLVFATIYSFRSCWSDKWNSPPPTFSWHEKWAFVDVPYPFLVNGIVWSVLKCMRLPFAHLLFIEEWDNESTFNGFRCISILFLSWCLSAKLFVKNISLYLPVTVRLMRWLRVGEFWKSTRQR